MVDRIKVLMESEGLNAAQFADKIGVQRSSISHLLSGRNKPSLEFVQKVLKAFPLINSDWLLQELGDAENVLYINDKSKHIKPKIEDFTQKDTNNQPNLISNANMEQPKSSIESIKKSIHKENNPIERIIIFYKNGMFKEYLPEPDRD